MNPERLNPRGSRTSQRNAEPRLHRRCLPQPSASTYHAMDQGDCLALGSPHSGCLHRKSRGAFDSKQMPLSAREPRNCTPTLFRYKQKALYSSRLSCRSCRSNNVVRRRTSDEKASESYNRFSQSNPLNSLTILGQSKRSTTSPPLLTLSQASIGASAPTNEKRIQNPLSLGIAPITWRMKQTLLS